MAEAMDEWLDERTASAATLLDPFTFLGGGSRIRGLGAAGAGNADHHAFHTDYVRGRPNGVTFSMSFDGLTATSGTLVLQINMLLPDAEGLARVVARERLSLPELAKGDTRTSLSCETFADCSYALVGMILGETDAAADGLSITLDAQTLDDAHPARSDGAHYDALNVSASDPCRALFTDGIASLASPVSQMCTAGQFDEPAYAAWIERLKEPLVYHRKQWEFIYILQVLDYFSMLRPGSRGLGFGVGREPMPAVMAAMGAEIVATDLPPDHDDRTLWDITGQHGSAVDSLCRPAVCDDAILRQRVQFRPVDMTAIPSDLQGFDFTWSSCAYEHLGSIEAGLKFVAESVACLRPGGIAVHTTELNITSDDRTLEAPSTVLFRRRDMEKLALSLIASGHEVAPINLDVGDRPLDRHVDLPPYLNDPHLKVAFGRFTTTSFGIIVRRGG